MRFTNIPKKWVKDVLNWEGEKAAAVRSGVREGMAAGEIGKRQGNTHGTPPATWLKIENEISRKQRNVVALPRLMTSPSSISSRWGDSESRGSRFYEGNHSYWARRPAMDYGKPYTSLCVSWSKMHSISEEDNTENSNEFFITENSNHRYFISNFCTMEGSRDSVLFKLVPRFLAETWQLERHLWIDICVIFIHFDFSSQRGFKHLLECSLRKFTLVQGVGTDTLTRIYSRFHFNRFVWQENSFRRQGRSWLMELLHRKTGYCCVFCPTYIEDP